MDLTDKIKNTEVERSIGNNRIVKRDGNDVTYSKKFNFYNENANRYLTILSTVNFNLEHKSSTETLAKLLDHDKSAFCCAVTLKSYINNKNIICIFDSHRKAYFPASREQIIDQIFGEWVKERQAKSIFALLKKKGVIFKVSELHRDNEKSETRKVYYLNPIFGQRTRSLSMDTYRVFKDVLTTPYLSTTEIAEGIAELDNKLYNKNVVSKVDTSKADEIFTSLEEKADGMAIFEKYYLRRSLSEEPKFQKVNGGMFKVENADLDKDTYFAANLVSSNIKKKPSAKDIVGYRGLYVDIDAGRNEDKTYLNNEDVAKAKADMLKVIDTLPTPTAVVETRNGYQVYWATTDINDAEVHRTAENQIIDILSIADHNVRDTARILRVPGTMWCKDPENKVKCEIVEASPVNYAVTELLQSFEDKKEAIEKACSQFIEEHDSIKRVLTKQKSNVAVQHGYYVKDNTAARLKDIEAGTTHTFKFLTCSAEFNIEKEAVTFLMHNVNLIDFLQLNVASTNETFNCVFHDDRHPSAVIFKNEKNGYRYYCNASSCAGNGEDGKGICIIDIVEILQNCNYRQALKYLFKVYNIKIKNVA
jgi:hypothetical protein|nr:MAG TPA: Replication protein B [Bacteriophage sp.]